MAKVRERDEDEDQDEDAWAGELRRQTRQMDGYTSKRLIAVAAEYGVDLVRLDPDEYTLPSFTWWPDGENGPEVLLCRMGFNWRIIETEGHRDLYRRSWCVPGNSELTFRLALIAMLGWRGRRDTQPAVFLKGYGNGPEEPHRLLHITVRQLLDQLSAPLTVAATHERAMDSIIREGWNMVRNPWDPQW